MKVLEYKGYFGSVEVDVEEGFLFGSLLFIRDVVGYRSDDIKGIRNAFVAAVDDYLATCAELGDEPDVPCKGSFNVRVGAELHQKIAVDAARSGIKLNEWVKLACEMKLASGNATAVDHVEGSRSWRIALGTQQSVVFEGYEGWQSNQQH